MCIKCDQMATPSNQFNEEELMEHHFDLSNEISFLAREIVREQQRIVDLSARLDSIESEMESREAKNSGPLN